MTESTTLFRFATAGSVDDGKSTLVGRLLYDSDSVPADHLEAIALASRERGFGGHGGGTDLALLTDGLRAEREQGITIDVAYRFFSTAARSFILADCPGHVQYTRNTVSGLTTADAVLLLADARTGVREQTRRHLAVAGLLRVPHVVVAVNKIDLIGFDPVRVREVEGELREAAAGLGIDDLTVVPVCATDGDNVVHRSERTPWYDGPPLLRVLETLPTGEEEAADRLPFRLPVQLALRPQGGIAPDLVTQADALRDHRSFAGRIASGALTVGDRVDVHPGGATTVVTSLTAAGRHVEHAVAGQSVAVGLADELDLARGSLLVAAGTLPPARDRVRAAVVWLDESAGSAGRRALVKWGTAVVPAVLDRIDGIRAPEGRDVIEADRVGVNDIAEVRLHLADALPVEPYTENRASGSFLLIDPQSGATLAAGTIRQEAAA